MWTHPVTPSHPIRPPGINLLLNMLSMSFFLTALLLSTTTFSFALPSDVSRFEGLDERAKGILEGAAAIPTSPRFVIYSDQV
jgi:hypothetical protein